MTATTDGRAMRDIGRHVLWFVGLWLAGVGVLAVVAWLLRMMVGAP